MGMTAPSRYPLAWPAGWPRGEPPSGRRPGNFKITLDKALQELGWEIERMGGRYPVISSNVELRRDGEMRRGAPEPHDRGVAVYFELKGKQKVFACDTFTSVRDNVRAIGLTIEALRSIERYGATAMLDRALSAFVALPPPSAPTHWDVLGLRPGSDREAIAESFRAKAKELHPDKRGSDAAMRALIDARNAALKEIGG
jgi:hypothetical protein